MSEKTAEQVLKDRADKAKERAKKDAVLAASDVKPGVEVDHAAIPGDGNSKLKRVWPKPGTPDYATLTPMEKAHATRAHRPPGNPLDRPKYLVFGRKTGGSAVYLIAELPTAARALRWIDDCKMLLDAHYDHVEIRRAKVYKVVKGV